LGRDFPVSIRQDGGSKQTGSTGGLDMKVKRIIPSLQEIESQYFNP
jgi:hypothetical protein